MHFLIETLENCENHSFQEHPGSLKICLHIMEKLYPLNHLPGDILPKRKYFSSAKLLILYNYFPRGGSRNPVKYKMEHFVTRHESF